MEVEKKGSVSEASRFAPGRWRFIPRGFVVWIIVSLFLLWRIRVSPPFVHFCKENPLLIILMFIAGFLGLSFKRRKEAGINAKERDDGTTALIAASREGHEEVVQALLDKGADVNEKANNGTTALIAASQEGHKEVVQALLDKGADVNAKNNGGVPALIIAALTGHKEVVELLLDKGADVNVRNNVGVTALVLASREGHKDVVQALLDKGADVNARANNGTTALMAVASKSHKEVVQALLDKGADVNAKDKKGTTALMTASYGVTAMWCRRCSTRAPTSMQKRTKARPRCCSPPVRMK